MPSIDPNSPLSQQQSAPPINQPQVSKSWIKKVVYPLTQQFNSLLTKIQVQAKKLTDLPGSISNKFFKTSATSPHKDQEFKISEAAKHSIIDFNELPPLQEKEDDAYLKQDLDFNKIIKATDDTLSDLEAILASLENKPLDEPPLAANAPAVLQQDRLNALKALLGMATSSPQVAVSDADKKLRTDVQEGRGADAVDYVNKQTQTNEVSRNVVYGPQEKNGQTYAVERLLAGILDDHQKYAFVRDPNTNQWNLLFEGKPLVKETWLITTPEGAAIEKQVYVFEGEKSSELDEIGSQNEKKKLASEPISDFSKFIKDVNFNHISLSDSQLKTYEDMVLAASHMNQAIVGKDVKQNPALSDESLTTGEKGALNLYTTDQTYPLIQKLMQGRMDSFPDTYGDLIKGTLLTASVATIGLNKLPDYQSEASKNTKTPEFLYRYESNLPQNMLEERIRAVQAGGEVATVTGFLSTGHTRPVATFEGEVVTIYENCKGKSIEALSALAEREVLLPPTQVQWVGYHKFVDENGKTLHIFVARAVTAGTYEGSSTRPSTEEIAANLPPPRDENGSA